MGTTPPRAGGTSRARGGRRTALEAVLSLALALLLATTPVAAQWTRAHPRVLLVTQTRDAPDGPSVRSATVSAIGFAREALSTLPGGEPVAVATARAQLALADLSAASTPSQILAIATHRYAAQAPTLAAELASMLRTLGASRALFILDQAAALPDEGDPRRLVWSLTVDPQGRFAYGAPRLQARQPVLLHARYVPRQLAPRLPATWGYPDPGRLYWQKVSLALQPLAPAQSIDTGGAFDPPLVPESVAHDPDAGLACLVDRRARPGCPATLPDLVGLIDTHGAAWALLDYARALQPVYDAQAGPDGSVESTARSALAVTRREVSRGTCTSGATYRNAGHLGVLLEATTDRIHVSPEGRSAMLARLRDTWLSPTHAYDHARPAPSDDPRALAAYIIDPLAPEGDLLLATSVPGLRELAPVEQTGGTPAAHARWASPSGGLARVDIEVTCPEPDRWIARSTISPWTRCYGGGCNSTYYPRELSFAPGRAGVADWAWTAYTYRGYPWEPQRIDYDGVDTLSFHHRSSDNCGSVITLRMSLSTRAVGADPPPPCVDD